jgi:hypothetical protein
MSEEGKMKVRSKDLAEVIELDGGDYTSYMSGSIVLYHPNLGEEGLVIPKGKAEKKHQRKVAEVTGMSYLELRDLIGDIQRRGEEE